jgi:hypothetical protein
MAVQREYLMRLLYNMLRRHGQGGENEPIREQAISGGAS